jgi:probable O-glycosylation ligase (exosortase A-associated)
MPEHWFARMSSITEYQADGSAMGRINAWTMALNLAIHRPLGGGFNTFTADMFALYAPNPDLFLDAHSIYFQVLGEHGFLGLALFLTLAVFTWRSASGVIKRCGNDPNTRWAADLAAMAQVSLIAYGSAGAFLGLAYFDLYYTMIAVVVLCATVSAAASATAQAEANTPVVTKSRAQVPSMGHSLK